MRQILNQYVNGNYTVTIYTDGTKVRTTSHTDFRADFPESIDMKITDWCDLNCGYCHEQSSTAGKHASILNIVKRLRGLMYAEIAIGGGNPLAHPDLMEILLTIRKNNLIPNITVNERHLVGDSSNELLSLVRMGLVHGVGVSWAGLRAFKSANSVAHVIAGVHSLAEMQDAYDFHGKILILGYKVYGKGQTYATHNTISKNIDYLSANLWKMFKKKGVISFDNLAIEQLQIKRHVPNWEDFYMGDDGKFTMYYDAVKDQFAKSSVAVREDADVCKTAVAYFQELNRTGDY